MGKEKNLGRAQCILLVNGCSTAQEKLLNERSYNESNTKYIDTVFWHPVDKNLSRKLLIYQQIS